MLKASYTHHILKFKHPSKTSRNTLTEKETWFIKIWESDNPQHFGLGECALFHGLSAEDCPEYEQKLNQICQNVNEIDINSLASWSSIRFGIETALKELQTGKSGILFPSPFTSGEKYIEINGLIWMGDQAYMLEQIKQKIALGYPCIKLKIGGINFENELKLLQYIRDRYTRNEIELRVDANGAFTPQEAMSKLNKLAAFDLHSIEQPIRPGQFKEMAYLCKNSPVPIALDEELINHFEKKDKIALLQEIKPQYLVLKPSLHGGIIGSLEWIEAAQKIQAAWWFTSALESNIGLNAIAQFAYSTHPKICQGLGTGMLYTNNIASPLELNGPKLYHNPNKTFDLNLLSI